MQRPQSNAFARMAGIREGGSLTIFGMGELHPQYRFMQQRLVHQPHLRPSRRDRSWSRFGAAGGTLSSILSLVSGRDSRSARVARMASRTFSFKNPPRIHSDGERLVKIPLGMHCHSCTWLHCRGRRSRIPGLRPKESEVTVRHDARPVRRYCKAGCDLKPSRRRRADEVPLRCSSWRQAME